MGLWGGRADSSTYDCGLVTCEPAIPQVVKFDKPLEFVYSGRPLVNSQSKLPVRASMLQLSKWFDTKRECFL